ncbi:HNH endonuclease [Paraburkholderia kirstenboschensis]|uniref:HNH endonuclease n=1 Tax=Paraburkholderia kirstenboschensis TaxID=1245436 RepID=UPI000FFB3BF7|nr:HNH endonuclease [Paraburkholderia kirstenboschensis]
MSTTMRSVKQLDEEEAAFLARPHKYQYLQDDARKIWAEAQKASGANREDRWAQLAQQTVLKPDPNPKGETRPIGAEIIAALRRHLANLQGTRCCYCRRWLQNIAHARPVEHILSRDDYPQFSLHYRNLALACRDCNQQKTNKNWTTLDKTAAAYPLPAEAGDYFHPRLPVFDGHIRYVRVETNDAAIAIYQGLTAQGRQLCRDHLKKISQVDALFKNNRQLSGAIERLQAAGDNPEEAEMVKLNEFVGALHEAIYRIAGG